MPASDELLAGRGGEETGWCGVHLIEGACVHMCKGVIMDGMRMANKVACASPGACVCAL